jgi:hypothetical protein
MAMLSDADLDKMLDNICARPRMYCRTIETGRDLIFYLWGVFRGAVYPAHNRKECRSSEDILAFRQYVYRRFNRLPPWPGFWRDGEFMHLLLEEYGESPYLDVCEAIGSLFRGIRDDDVNRYRVEN